MAVDVWFVVDSVAVGTIILEVHYYYFFAINFMRGIYSYIPEWNRVVRVYSIAAFLYLQFVLRIMLFGMFNVFCTFTVALSEVCV